MDSSLQSPTKMRPGTRDTGFPAPFCGNRNTRLPHPDADLSPNASISADDISVTRMLARTRRSFLAKHKRTISHGMITPDMERVYGSSGGDHLAMLDENTVVLSPTGTMDSGIAGLSASSSKRPQTSDGTAPGRLSKDGADSINNTDTSANGDDEAPTGPRQLDRTAAAPGLTVPQNGAEEPSRRRSVLRKFKGLH